MKKNQVWFSKMKMRLISWTLNLTLKSTTKTQLETKKSNSDTQLKRSQSKISKINMKIQTMQRPSQSTLCSSTSPALGQSQVLFKASLSLFSPRRERLTRMTIWFSVEMSTLHITEDSSWHLLWATWKTSMLSAPRLWGLLLRTPFKIKRFSRLSINKLHQRSLMEKTDTTKARYVLTSDRTIKRTSRKTWCSSTPQPSQLK